MICEKLSFLNIADEYKRLDYFQPLLIYNLGADKVINRQMLGIDAVYDR